MEVVVGGVACRYRQEGEGRDVLLLHGWGGEADSLLPLFEALKGRCRVTAIDFAGHGGSGKPAPQGWSVTEYMEWTRGVIEALGIAPCDIVAHSFGGRVSILLCATYPRLVRRLVLTASHGIVGKKTFAQRARARLYKMLRAVAGILPGGERLRKRLAERFGSADYNALDEQMRRTFVKVVNQDLREYLPRIAAPTLLIWGSEDTATPLWFAHVMEREIPDAGLVVYEGCGHFAYLERAAEFNRVVAHFLLDS